MPEWLIEQGIGETRFARVDEGAIVETRVLLDETIAAGTALRATLKRSGKPAVAAVGDTEFLLPGGAPTFAEGQAITIEVTRERIPGAEPWKRPLARVREEEWRSAELPSGETLALPAPADKLENSGWSDVLEEARSGLVRFDGGELHLFATPAMTLIDVDGTLPPTDLAVRAAREAAKAILRLGIGGSIGIDFPTVTGKAARTEVDRAIDSVLPKPFERTSLNGFGFLQIVRPRRHASLLELAQDRAPFEARALLRRVTFEDPGAKRLVAHPAVVAVFEAKPEWLAALAKQIGGAVTLRADASVPIHGAYAEKV